MTFLTLDGVLYSEMIKRAAGNLKVHAEEVNNLNVFPIPDGDTGDNMLLTMLGGVNAIKNDEEDLGKASGEISQGMLLGARGNSGVILSQFFDGISKGFAGLKSADISQIEKAFQSGVKQAYSAVVTPAEGTILTVAKDAVNAACECNAQHILDFIEAFLKEAEASLKRTPDLLPVLKRAGVVDSGGAGLIYIMRGFRQVLLGEKEEVHDLMSGNTAVTVHGTIDLDKFNEDSVLEFGYCTECLLRLQNAKCNPAEFDVNTIKNYLETLGDSIVTFKTGSIIKLHVHTKTPAKVLEFCQQFGEFLTLKIENMSLQHNNLGEDHAENKNKADTLDTTVDNSDLANERKAFGVVSVATGEGIKKLLKEHNCDEVVEGGQSMNPSAEDFINAFEKINADTIFVFPNNSNVILAAQQAASIYKDSDIRVIESKTIGEGYAALCMMDTEDRTADEVQEDLNFAMEGVDTYQVTHCIRDAEMDGIQLHTGDYIGILGKSIKGKAPKRLDAVKDTIDHIDFTDHECCILIRGNDSIGQEFEEIQAYMKEKYPRVEQYAVNGGQEVYSYILIVL